MAKKITKKHMQAVIAVIYARFSSHNQKEESIEQQVEECQKYAAANGYEVIDIYSDKAITGKRETRAAYQRMLRDAERHRFQIIIAYKSNRIARNMLNALQLENRMEEHGIKILYAKEEFGNNAAGRFALRMMMNVNQFYSENMAEDIIRGMRDNAKDCKANNGTFPLGYKMSADKKFEIVPEEAAVVREIFVKTREGVPFVDIANELNARGIPTKGGARWNKSSFAKLLANEKYIGTYTWSDIRIEGGVPQIIEKDLFEEVQDMLKNKKNPRGRHREAGDYLLTGRLFCGKCGALMTGMSGTSETGDKHYYYACITNRTQRSCNKKAVRRERIESKIAAIVKEYVLCDETIRWMVDCCMEFQKNTFESQQLSASRQRLSEVVIEVKNMVDAIAHGIYTDSTKGKLLELEAEKKALERSIEQQTYSLKPFDREHIEFFIESFKDGNVEDKTYQKRLFDQFVNAIYLYDDEVRISFSGSKNKDKIPFKIIENAEELAEASVRIDSSQVDHDGAKRTIKAAIYMVGSTFILVSEI